MWCGAGGRGLGGGGRRDSGGGGGGGAKGGAGRLSQQEVLV